MADDDWASWKPSTSSTVEGQAAFRARATFSRDGSAAPSESSALDRTAAVRPSAPPRRMNNGPASANGRQALPDPPSFSSRGGGSRNFASGQAQGRGPTASTSGVDRGWGRRAPSTEPLTAQRSSAGSSNATRESLDDRTRRRLADEREKLSNDRSRNGTRQRSPRRSRSRERDGESLDRDAKRRRRDLPDSVLDRRNDVRGERSRSVDRRIPRGRDGRETDRAPRSDDRYRSSRREPDGGQRSREPEDRPRERTDRDVPHVNGRQTTRDDKKQSSREEDGNIQSSGLGNGHQEESTTILVSGLIPGTTTSDLKAILQTFGKVNHCKAVTGSSRSKLAFEVGFNSLRAARDAIEGLDGTEADGSVLAAIFLSEQVESDEEEEPKDAVKSVSISEEKKKVEDPPSLLSRLGAQPNLETSKVNGRHSQPSPAAQASALPDGLLYPYEGLLRKAGIDSLQRLQQLVRPATAKEYVEMLCDEFPEEQLLKGLTARWALRERLEEWLGEKSLSNADWGERPRKPNNAQHTAVASDLEDEGEIDLV